jgi:hypothetical protein
VIKSYDLSNIEELVQFDIDCTKAVNGCPQRRGRSNNFIKDGITTSVSEVFIYWFNNSVLWSSGYYIELSEKAQETFKRYACFKNRKVVDIQTNKVFKYEDIIRIETKHVAV